MLIKSIIQHGFFISFYNYYQYFGSFVEYSLQIFDDMLVIDKHRVADWMLLSYLAEQRQLHEKIVLFEKKYRQTFNEFKSKTNQKENENFLEWDDLIEWQAYTDFYTNITKTINDIKSGNFQVA